MKSLFSVKLKFSAFYIQNHLATLFILSNVKNKLFKNSFIEWSGEEFFCNLGVLERKDVVLKQSSSEQFFINLVGNFLYENTLLHFLQVKAFLPVTMEALSFLLWWFFIQTQGAHRAEGGDTWLEMRTPVLFVLDPRPRICPPIHLPWRKEMQSSLFYRQEVMVTPCEEGPSPTVMRNNVASAFFTLWSLVNYSCSQCHLNWYKGINLKIHIF